MENFQTQRIFDDCFRQLKIINYTGFDPADLLNTTSGFIKKLPSPVIRILTILNFLSPVNFRKILKIQPTQNTTAMVVMARALLNKYRETNNEEYKSEAIMLSEWMLKKSLRIDNSIGWARVIPYQSRKDFQHENQSTLTFINSFALELFLDLYDIEKNEEYSDIAKKIRNHIVTHTNRIIREKGCCLSYINNAHEEVLNASVMAGAVLNRFAHEFGDSEALELSLNIADYILHRQNPDGSWEYSYKANGKPKRQYDFHQSYVLDSLKRYNFNNDAKRAQKIENAFNKGIDFYFSKQFDNKMRPYWRYPVKYPIDIHNVSHAIYFIVKYFEEIPDASLKLNKLLLLLVNEFYDTKNHFFYYHKYPFFMVRHNFFRWNTVWTLYALSIIKSNTL